MKIVVLDGFTLNPGDLSWEWLQEYGEYIIHDRTSAADVATNAKGATVLLTNKTPISEDVLNQLPDLRYIGVLATGYNIVDTRAALKKGIIVSNVPGYGTPSVVQMTFGLILELCLHIQRHSDTVFAGKWARSLDFCYWDFPLVELSGKTLGIIGFGEIGQKVCDVATAFGMNVISVSANKSDQSTRDNFRWVELDELYTQSDIISIHCPLTDATRGLIREESLLKMKKSAFLINTSRGPIVVEEDLAKALNKGVIAGAALDVLSVEPPSLDNPIYGAKNCIVTPHISWATKEARSRLMNITAENLQAFILGKPINVVNR